MPPSIYNKKITTVVLVLGIIVVVVILKKFAFQGESIESRIMRARSKGNISAPVKINEYIDLQCPACAYGSKVLKNTMEKNPNKIHLQMNYFPLGMHRHAMTASYYAECSAFQDKFWQFHDIVLQEQDDWKSLADARPYFDKITERIGIKKVEFGQCLNDPSIAQRILADKQTGETKGIKSTPTYFINGEMVVGARSLVEKLTTLLGSNIL